MKKTPLTEVHRQLGAKMVEFAGWEMPIQYGGVIDEHKCVRSNVGLFDLSHMGEILISGADAEKNVTYLTANDPRKLQNGQIQYSMLLNEAGGIIDDILVYRVPEGFYLVVNSSNLGKDYEWITEHCTGDCRVTDLSDTTALLAIQGPKSQPLVESVFGCKFDDLEYYHFRDITFNDQVVRISRTGYTGEDGFELYFDHNFAITLWDLIMSEGKAADLQPIGLAARDTLRLEVRMPLHGNDIDETTTPIEAGLGGIVQYDKDFIGKEALLKQKEEGRQRKLVGFIMEERGIPRPGYVIRAGEGASGIVTSGSMSPTRKQAVGMGYIPTDAGKPGQHIEIEIRGKLVQAILHKGRFVQIDK